MKVWTRRELVGFALICGLLTACATARVVSVQPHKGGVVSVNPPQDPEARNKAFALMTDNCGSGGYDIVEEGESVVGTTSHSSLSGGTNIFGQPSLAGDSSTENKTEWRISYKCK